MRIDYFQDHPEIIPILAPAIVAHYESMDPEENLARRIEKLRSHMNKDELPIAWVAHSEGEPLDMAALRVHDLEGRVNRKIKMPGALSAARKGPGQGIP